MFIGHSLAAAIGWATLFALLYFAFTRYRAGTVLIWLGVVSHWVLDFVSHRPDMPLYPGGPGVGLGLWNSVLATVVVEGLMYAIGVWIYIRVTHAKDRIGRVGFSDIRCGRGGVIRRKHSEPAAAGCEGDGNCRDPVHMVIDFVGVVGRQTSGAEVRLN